MIFPIPFSQIRLGSIRVTLALMLINFALFLVTLPSQNKTHADTSEYFDNAPLVRFQGEVFGDFILANQEHYNSLMTRMSELALSGHVEQLDLLGHLAFRDNLFIKKGVEHPFRGDQILHSYWKSEYQNLREKVEHDPMLRWGLVSGDSSLMKWVTYQFLHGGAWHIISNMIFLLVFGLLLEPILGSSLFLFSYLLSGFFAAGTFIELSGVAGVPLVGASGAVSGLMGMIVAIYGKQKIRFLYWILPIRGYYGYIWLPAWVLLVAWGVSDLAGYLSTVREIGGIAHAAHIGGALNGLVLGYLYRIGGKSSAEQVFGYSSWF